MPDARPYRVADRDSVRAGAWSMTTPTGERALPEWLDTWDLGRRLDVRRRLVLDGEAFRRSTALTQESALAIGVVLATQSFTMTIARERVRLIDGAMTIDLTAELSGRLAADVATLRTTVTLDEAPASSAPRTATRRGSVLWQDRCVVRLHGDSSQFPITVIEFGKADGFDAAAPWQLDLGTDLERPAMGMVRLFVNRRFAHVVEGLTGDVDGPGAALLRSMMFADVGRTLVERALSIDDLESDWPEESLGAVLRDLTARLSVPLDALRKERETDPMAWAARCHATFRSTEGLG
jgi:hypothetical protein